MEKTEVARLKHQRRALRCKVFKLLSVPGSVGERVARLQSSLHPYEREAVGDDLHYFLLEAPVRRAFAKALPTLSALVDQDLLKKGQTRTRLRRSLAAVPSHLAVGKSPKPRLHLRGSQASYYAADLFQY